MQNERSLGLDRQCLNQMRSMSTFNPIKDRVPKRISFKDESRECSIKSEYL